jgi:hypothetical protein
LLELNVEAMLHGVSDLLKHFLDRYVVELDLPRARLDCPGEIIYPALLE